MIYVATPSSPLVREAMVDRRLACMTTPAQGNRVPAGALWAADNGVYGDGYPGDAAWLAWLRSRPYDRDLCLFATAPDVVGDAWATLIRSEPFLPLVRDAGYPAAFVAQDGAEETGVPWDDLDCLFLGGSTGWKLSEHAAHLASAARSRAKWVHMGRVNSWRRWQIAEAFGCDSVDGTFLAFGPDYRLPEVLAWTGQPALF